MPSSETGNLLLPDRRKNANRLVVAGETVDTRLDENEAELGVLVLAVALKVLADSDSLEKLSIYRSGTFGWVLRHTFLINM